MKKSKFTKAQIAFILRQAEEGTPLAEVCRKAEMGEATFYNWRKKYAGLMPSEMRRLRQLEEENARLARGRPLARQADAAGRHQAKALRPARKRSMVGHMRAS